jgi:hypothetical protein
MTTVAHETSSNFTAALNPVAEYFGLNARQLQVISVEFAGRVPPDVWRAACAVLLRGRQRPSIADIERAIGAAQTEIDKANGYRPAFFSGQDTYNCARCLDTGYRRIVVGWGGRELTAVKPCDCSLGRDIAHQLDPKAFRSCFRTSISILCDAETFDSGPCSCGGVHSVEDQVRCACSTAGRNYDEWAASCGAYRDRVASKTPHKPPVSIEYVGADRAANEGRTG